MVGVSEEFVSGEDCDRILSWLSEDTLNEDEDFSAQIANVVYSRK